MEKIKSILSSNEDYAKIIAEGKPWEDSSFPRNSSVTKGLTNIARWKRASEIFENREKVYESFSGDDVVQGSLKDSYLLAAVSALAEYPGRVQKLFIQKDKNSAGCYVVRLYVCGRYVDVLVDDFFPVDKNGTPVFAGSNNQELWVMLIEKAWAKIHGSYTAIEGGDTRESLAAITGAPVEYYKHKDMREDDLWEMLGDFLEENYVMCSAAAIETKGISNGYAYTLVNVYELTINKEPVRLVQMSDPLAKTEWTGAWSDKDGRWTAELREKVEHSFKDDGTFFMPFDEFREVFTHTFVAKVSDNYVYSSRVIQGQKGFVGFRVTHEFDGYISGYQITKRLGSTVVPNFAVERLKIELYKFSKSNKLELVKDVWNNPVGQANMEITLDPGTYVLKGSFDFSTKLPYIVFSSYGERRLNFVELKIKNQRHATLEMVNESLSKLKRAYTTATNTRKSAGTFRTCLMEHKLEWSEEPFKEETNFECENCQAERPVEEGRWFCNKCGYDICEQCRPREFSRAVGMDNGEILCSRDHKMKFAASKNSKDLYLCDQCGRAYYSSVSRWRCEECDLSLCRLCRAPPASFREREDILEIETCPNGDKLEFVTTDSTDGVYNCYICTKVGDVHNGRWACLDCDISVCPVCKPSSKAKEGMLSVKTMTLACTKKHMLQFGCRPADEGETLQCYKCENPLNNDNWRWTCDECNFNICVNCRPEPEGRRDLQCSNMHKLAYSILPLGKVTFGRCDKCHKVFKLTGGRYSCFGCNYECCNNCVPKASASVSDEPAIVERSVRRRKPAQETAATAAQPQNQEGGCVML